MNTPLWQALQAAVGRRAASFHTPGHKNGRIVPQALAAAQAWGSSGETVNSMVAPASRSCASISSAL